MKLKHILSIVSSFFLMSTSKGQEKKPSIKKETAPQLKNSPNTKPAASGESVSGKLPAAMDYKMMPKKDYVGKTQRSAAPIMIKPGDQLYAASFNNVEDGEMPTGWRSSGMGSVVKVDGRDGKWFKINESTQYVTAYDTTLPQNYKVEFDFIANFKDDQVVPELSLRLYKKGSAYSEAGVSFLISPNGGTSNESTRIQVASHNIGGSEKFRSTARTLTNFGNKNGKNEPVHVALSVKGQQVKAWIDGEKVYDLQDVVPQNVQFNKIAFETSSYGGPKENYQYYISNVKVTAE